MTGHVWDCQNIGENSILITHTPYDYRINEIRQEPGNTWLFLPEGPGLGSEYLTSLCTQLQLQGTIQLIDYPQDGTNTQGLLNISYWKKGLIELIKSTVNPILVAHGFSGLLVLDTPELAPYLKGLVLINTAPQPNFVAHIEAMKIKHHLPDLAAVVAEYHLAPSLITYKEFWNTYKYYCFTSEELTHSEQLMSLFAFNHEAYYYSLQHFYPNYQGPWLPTIPTLMIASDHDFIYAPTSWHEALNSTPKPHIMHQIIHHAGHYPWLLEQQQIQSAFTAYVHFL